MTWSLGLQRRLHADHDGFLADIEVAEAADQAHAVELAGLLLEAADQEHVGVEFLELVRPQRKGRRPPGPSRLLPFGACCRLLARGCGKGLRLWQATAEGG